MVRFSKLKIKAPPQQLPPVLCIAAFGIIGTIIGLKFQDYFMGNSSTIVAITISISVLGLCFKTKQHLFVVLVIATAGLFCTNTTYESHLTPQQWLAFNDGSLVQVQGVVQTTPSTQARTMGVLSIIDEREPVTTFELLAHIYNEDNNNQQTKTTLFVEVNGNPKISLGDEITTVGTLRRLLYGNKRGAKLYVSYEKLIILIHKNLNSEIEIKNEIKHRIKKGITGEEKTFISAVFFGERGEFWQELSSVFRGAGLSHILAISGLHIGIIIVIVFLFVQMFPFGRVFSVGSILITLLVLSNIIEDRPPVFRAIVMIGLFTILQIGGSRLSGAGILSLVLLVAMWINPTVVNSAGFILSFTVVFGLFLLLPTMQWKLIGPHNPLGTPMETARHKLSSLWVAGLCAILCATPLTTYLFGTIAPVGLISSLGGVLLLTTVLIIGIVRLGTGWVHPLLDEACRWLLQKTSTITIESAGQYGKVPFAFENSAQTDFLWITLWFIVLIFIVLKRGRTKIKIVLVILLSLYAIHKPEELCIKMTTLHVGHGTCHVIQDGNTTVVVDAGSRTNLDVGLNKVLPMLNKNKIRKIDVVIVTHNDLDHCSGILDLLHSIPIGEIYMTPHALRHPTQVINKIIQTARRKKIIVQNITAGWSMKTHCGIISALWPLENSFYSTPNEASVVLSIQSAGRTILLTGDITEKTITTFLESKINTVDVLELPHHGQWSVQSLELVHKLKPSAVIQSTNKTRFSVDKWLIPRFTDRFVTCIDGNITTTIQPNGEITIETSYTNLSTTN